MMMVRQALTNAAREGCRHACLITTQNSTSSDPIARASLKGVISNAVASGVIRVTTEPAFLTPPGEGINITTSVEVDCSDVSWLPAFFTSGAKIRGTSSMNRE